MQKLIENKDPLVELLKHVLVITDGNTLLLSTTTLNYIFSTKTAEHKQQVLDLIISLAIQNNLGHIAIHNKNGELKRIDGKSLDEPSLVYCPQAEHNIFPNGAKNIYEVALNNWYGTTIQENSSIIYL